MFLNFKQVEEFAIIDFIFPKNQVQKIDIKILPLFTLNQSHGAQN